MTKAINKAIEELTQEKTLLIDEVILTFHRLKKEITSSIDPVSKEDVKIVFEKICKFIKMDDAVVILRNIENVDYSDLINDQ